MKAPAKSLSRRLVILLSPLQIAAMVDVNNAEVSKPATVQIESVLESVDRHYPLIAASIHDIRKAESDVLAANGSFDPLIKSSGQKTPMGEYTNQSFDAVIEQPTTIWGSRIFTGYRYGEGKFGPYDEKMKTNSGGELRAGLEVPILRGGLTDERRTKIATSEKGYNAAVHSLELQRLDAKRQAVIRYYDWLSAIEKLQIADELLKLAVERDEATRHRVRRGDAALIDQVDNERSVIQRKAASAAAKRLLNKMALELSMYWRDQSGAPITPNQGSTLDLSLSPKAHTGAPGRFQAIQAEAPKPDPESHPEVRRMKVLLDQNNLELLYLENQFLPKVDAEISISQDMGSGVDAKEKFEYKAGVKVELPLRMRTQRGKLEGVLANRAKLEAQLNLARDRIIVTLRDYSQAIETAKDRSEMILQELQLSQKVEEAERQRFKHGDSNLLMVNIREQTTADARQRAVDALADLYKAVSELKLLNQVMLK